MNKLLSTLLCAFLVSCASSPGPSAGVKPPKLDPPQTISLTGEPVWNTMEDVKKAVGSRGRISGKTLDLQGNAISGSKIKKPGSSQNENAIPLRIKIDGFTLKNGIVLKIPGGVVVKADNVTFEKLTFTDIGEDAVSTATDAAPGIRILNCKFYNSSKGDKSIQANDARNAVIDGNFITGGQTAVRLQESSSKSRNVKATVTGNTFEKVPTAVNVNGYTTVTASGNTYKEVAEKWNGGSHTKIIEK